MRIAFCSDLHVDISKNNWELVPHLAEVLKIVEPDVFILAGDISPELGDIEYTLDMFSLLRCHKLFVPGNQDIWVLSEEMQEQGHDSYEKYYFFLPDVCRRNGFVPLWMEPFRLGPVGFAGSIGWYEALPGLAGQEELAEDEEAARLLDSAWSDMRWACWCDISTLGREGLGPLRRTNEEVAREFNLRLDQDIEELERDPNICEVVVVTHFPPFPPMGCWVGERGDRLVFPGSQEMGSMLLSHRKVVLSISGHVHERGDIMVSGVRAVRSPVGYLGEDHRKPQAVVEEKLEIVQLWSEADLSGGFDLS
ncbi:MAG: metallophosphoesterase [Candidatus Geothermincolales bacterium]